VCIFTISSHSIFAKVHDQLPLAESEIIQANSISRITLLKREKGSDVATPICQVRSVNFPELIPSELDYTTLGSALQPGLKNCNDVLEMNILSDFSEGIEERTVAGLHFIAFGLTCAIAGAGGAIARAVVGKPSPVKSTLSITATAGLTAAYGNYVGGIPIGLSTLTPSAPIAGIFGGAFACIGTGALIADYIMTGD